MKHDKQINVYDNDADVIDRLEILDKNSSEMVDAIDGHAQAVLLPTADPIVMESDKVGPAGISDPSATDRQLTLDEEVERDISECNRINGVESLFAQSDTKVRMALVPAYQSFRRATADPAYCQALANRLFDQARGLRKPSEKKPWCLAARLALRPQSEDEVARTYEAAYYLRHAALVDVPVLEFGAWIVQQGQKASRDYVRENRKIAGTAKKRQPVYPNIARAKKIKGDGHVTAILKSAFDLAEADLGELFARKDMNDA